MRAASPGYGLEPELDQLVRASGLVEHGRARCGSSASNRSTPLNFADARGDGSDRVVRVGTHALTATSQATLWGRLCQHRGPLADRHAGDGNHCTSVLRRHVGAPSFAATGCPRSCLAPGWTGTGHGRDGRRGKEQVDHAVSDNIRAMPLLSLSVPDPADRASVGRNSIALTSRLASGQDPPSSGWLGGCAARPEITDSGLRNPLHAHAPITSAGGPAALIAAGPALLVAGRQP